jgi:hypothetical protein
MKTCSKCSSYKDNSEFSKRSKSLDGLHCWCKPCSKEYLKSYYLENKEIIDNKNKEYYYNNTSSFLERSKQYREENKEKNQKYFKEYYINNKEELSNYKKEFFEKNKEEILQKSKIYKEENKEYYLEYLKNWREENKEYSKEYWKQNRDKKRKYDREARQKYPHIFAWRATLKSVIIRLGSNKEKSTIDLLGYSAEEFKNHIQSSFKEGMSWDNWGEWHIDHIIPVSKFDKNTPVNIVNSLDNLQPLWASENLSKNNRLI